MFAIAFDLVVADTARHHPKDVSQAYADVGNTLASFGFDRGTVPAPGRQKISNGSGDYFVEIARVDRCVLGETMFVFLK